MTTATITERTAASEQTASTENQQYAHATSLLTERAECGGRDRHCARLREQAIVDCLPLAEHIARRFSGRGEPYDDLHQVARMGLIQAIDRFDPRAGSNLLSFAVPTVMGEVRRHFRDRAPTIRVPRRSRELYEQVKIAREELAQEQQGDPSDEALAERLQTTPSAVRKAMDDCACGAAVSLDAVGTAGGEVPALTERLGERDPGFEEVDDVLVLDPVVRGLSARDRRILGLRFYDCKSQREIAEAIGCSQMHVSRRLRQTLNRLHAELTAAS